MSRINKLTDIAKGVYIVDTDSIIVDLKPNLQVPIHYKPFKFNSECVKCGQPFNGSLNTICSYACDSKVIKGGI